MRLFIIVYGIVVLAGAVVVARDPGYFGNVGFLVVGALLGIYPAFIIEEIRRARAAKNLAKALFHELANRVGRCCFDFEAPWRAYLQPQYEMNVLRLRKFVPEPPVIYPAVAPQIALLKADAAQAIIDFYIALAAWRREIENTADEFQHTREGVDIGPVRLLARRLRRTLEPGERALEALARHVPAAAEIERNAMRDGDRLFPDAHPYAGKTVRERINLVLSANPEDQAIR
jgi:hypothetical protein